MNTTTWPDCHVICGSLLLIVTDKRSGQTVEALPCDGIDAALERIADRVTHPEEDFAVSMDVLSGVWNDHVAQGGDTRDFVFDRPNGGVGRTFTFSLFSLDRVGADELSAHR